MKSYILVFAIIMLIFLVLIYPFRIRISLHLDFFRLVGFVSVKAYFLKLFSGKLIVDDQNKIKLVQEKKKNKKSKPTYLLNIYFTSLLKRLTVKDFEWYFSCGSDTDANFVSLICGYVLAFDAVFSGILLNRYKHVEIFNDVDPSFEKDSLEISTKIIVCFSIFDVLWSLFVAYKEYFKIMKESKNV